MRATVDGRHPPAHQHHETTRSIVGFRISMTSSAVFNVPSSVSEFGASAPPSAPEEGLNGWTRRGRQQRVGRSHPPPPANSHGRQRQYSCRLRAVSRGRCHLTQGDSSSRVDRPLRDARLARAQRIPPEFWPELTAHGDELVADCAAVGILADSVDLAVPLPTAMVGSMVAVIVAGRNGWKRGPGSSFRDQPNNHSSARVSVVVLVRGAQRRQTGVDRRRSSATGTLERFHKPGYGMGGPPVATARVEMGSSV